ncbi:recombinase family protein [Hathewaya histolytica]|uniref:recombinase family protein n=1 Tax=Hathewaya histolytica TaxID=1498 RepID=UPI003B67410E
MKIAIYSRKSIDTSKGESIENQIKMCKDYFNLRNKNCTFEVFEDEGFSGGNTNRPSFKLMMNKIKKDKFDVVACYKVDRIARNIVDFVNIYDELDKLGVKLISITEGFDASTPIGKLLMVLLASFAEMERENIKQRVTDNMRELSKKGRWTGGITPTGYTTERILEYGREAVYLKLQPEYIDVVKYIFQLYANNKSLHSISKQLFKEKALKYCESTIKGILSSPVYVKSDEKVMEFLKMKGYDVYGKPNGKGIITYNRRPQVHGKRRWNDKSMFCAVSKHEAVIESDLWIKTQITLNKNAKAPRPKHSNISYLTTRLRCKTCGYRMSVTYNHKRADGHIHYTYVCTGRKTYGKSFCDSKQISMIKLDNKLKDKLSKLELDFDTFKKSFKLETPKEDNKLKLKDIRKKLKTNETKIDNLIDKLSILPNNLAIKITNKIKELNSENEELRNELFLLESENDNTNIDNHINEMYYLLKEVNTILDNKDLTIEDKRTFIETLTSKIIYDSTTQDVDPLFN